MSAPVLWIVLPGFASVLLWLLRKRPGRMLLLVLLLCLGLAGLAWLAPIDQPIRLGSLSLRIQPALAFAGRRLLLENNDRAVLVFLYLLCAFWFGGSRAAGANMLLIPFGMGVVALLVAALAVEPFLYAALLVEMAVLLAVPILAPPGTRVGQGVLRFLIFQTLAMPFILLAGWALAGVEASPANLTLVTIATVFLGLGFAFWLAVFPFYTWIPLLAEQAFPYVSGFIFVLLPTISLLLGLNFLTAFSWLNAAPALFRVIALIGSLMVVTAGVWAAFQRDLARMFGYAVIVETGFSLLAIGLSSATGMRLFSSMFLPRVLALGVWALSLSIIVQRAGSASFDDVLGVSQHLPFASSALVVAALTLAGLPLLGVFPIRQALLESIAQGSLLTALWSLAGMVGLMFGAFRALAVMARGRTAPQAIGESRGQIALLVIAIVALLLIGLLPQLFLPLTDGLGSAIRPGL